MASRRKIRQREAQLAFEALSIEGGLISPEWLARVAQLDAGHQAETDYRIPKGLNLRDEIGRYWRIAQAHWADFARARAARTATREVTEPFVAALLKECLGFASLGARTPVIKGERTYPLAWAALEGRVPVVIVAPHPPSDGETGSALDDLSLELGDTGRRRSAFGLAQEYLNTDEDALWAVVSDGLALRLCRDNASLTRPAWIEADLDRIFREERYSDFAALWLLAHETRFGAPGQPVSACHLETWRAAGREEGTRAREFLRDGVETALVALGKGFLANPDNQALRAALHDGKLSANEYFQELLRLVYRLIFLLTAEERDLLHPAGVPDAVRALYAQGYGLRRLRDRAVKRSAHDRFGDLWEGLKIVLRGVATGEPRLGLPALGGLFAADQCPHLDAARLENRALLTAVFRLSWLKGDSGLARVNWRDMGPEELGSVYESLLELVPVIPPDHRGFSFATGDETKGNARKTTGSYYTPDSLVQLLLDSALEPVVQGAVAAHPGDPVEALLKLSIVDPACGSGHFLLAAARRLAVHVARFQAKGTPSAEQYRHAVRQVVSRCLYGVDLNPMAVELCRVSLWMEAVEPGRPLSFLDSHVQHGNALLGTTPELMVKGIPDAAFEPIEGDDKKTASLLKKKNKAAEQGQRGFDALWAKPADTESAEVVKAVAALEAAPDGSIQDVAGKAAQWERLQRSLAFTHQKFVADAWCAAFVWPKPPTEPKKVDAVVAAAPTNDLWRPIRDGQGSAPAETVKIVAELATRYHFFHWHLAFPQVFARGGFDVVLGNPPWERLKLQEKEWFAGRAPEIAAIPDAADRGRAIKKLRDTDSQLAAEYARALRAAEAEAAFLQRSGRFRLVSGGDLNTYALFAECAVSLVGRSGRVGIVVPSAIAGTLAYQPFVVDLVESGRLASFLDFENAEGLFPEVHRSYRFCLLVTRSGSSGAATCAFMLRRPSDAKDGERTFELKKSDLALLSPNTGAFPTFRNRRDAALTRRIYESIPVLVNERTGANPWGIKIYRMIDANEDADLLRDVESGAPQRGPWVRVYEGKMIDAFNHRYAESYTVSGGQRSGKATLAESVRLQDPCFVVGSRYQVNEAVVKDRMDRWSHPWLVAFMDVCSATNERTMVPTIIPWAGATKSLRLVRESSQSASRLMGLLANWASFVFDYCVRQSVSGLHLSEHVVKQLPVVPPERYSAEDLQFIVPRVLELSYTAWDLEPFARELGYVGSPFLWSPERRFLLRAELDAVFFHLYGISHNDADYILETFPIVKKNDEKAHREYRTKRVILEIYDAMAEAIRTGKPYQTRLDPPPADPRVAHPARAENASGAGPKRKVHLQ